MVSYYFHINSFFFSQLLTFYRIKVMPTLWNGTRVFWGWIGCEKRFGKEEGGKENRKLAKELFVCWLHFSTMHKRNYRSFLPTFPVDRPFGTDHVTCDPHYGLFFFFSFFSFFFLVVPTKTNF